MATITPRINVTFDTAELQAIKYLAKKYKKSMSAVIKQLALEAMEYNEDYCLSKIADDNLKKSKKTIPQEKVWEKFGV